MPITIQKLATSCLIISWENHISTKTSHEVYFMTQAIKSNFINQFVDCVPTYCSLTLYLKSNRNVDSLTIQLLDLYQSLNFSSKIESQHWEIPVCYHTSLGVDLASLSVTLNLSINEIISLHSSPIYTVDFIGFLPGFPYLSGLNKQLHAHRLTSPRNYIQKGSVAIGGNQTGIYPQDSPAGWNIIGRTNIELFNSMRIKPCLLSPMDTLQFVPISLSEFNNYKSHD